MLLHKLKGDRRALSNVIVIVLSLILIVVIVADVVLWSYEMNQFDWERAEEKLEITYVGQYSSWSSVSSEFSLIYGLRVEGDYLDTQKIDGSYESFAEEAVNTTPSGWFNSSWEYRKPIIIDNTLNPSQLTDFQILITFSSASLIDEGKMRSDCGDLRFADANGVKLNYWIESGINTENTRVWVKIPLVPAGSSTTIYMYYGNPEATSESNGTATFEFFDDFENLNNWNLRGSSSTTLIAENRTVVKITSRSYNPEGIYTKNFFNVTNKIIELELKGFGNSDLDAAVYVDTRWATNYYGSVNINHFIGDNYAGNTHRVYLGGAFSAGSQYTRSQWAIATLIVNNTGITGIYMGETLSLSGSPSTYVGFIALQADNDGSPNTRYYYVDWIRMRKYAKPEPTVSIGEEEPRVAYRINFTGDFEIDLDKYPLESIQEIQISITARASDTSENCSLEVYDWENTAFIEAGTLNLTGNWHSNILSLTENPSRYISENGSVRIGLRDNSLDSLQTIVDLDFLAVRVVIDGICICLSNKGASTVHIVSLWINNSTHHMHYDADFFLNSGETDVYVRTDIPMPRESYILKVVTEKGNLAVYSLD